MRSPQHTHSGATKILFVYRVRKPKRGDTYASWYEITNIKVAMEKFVWLDGLSLNHIKVIPPDKFNKASQRKIIFELYEVSKTSYA